MCFWYTTEVGKTNKTMNRRKFKTFFKCVGMAVESFGPFVGVNVLVYVSESCMLNFNILTFYII